MKDNLGTITPSRTQQVLTWLAVLAVAGILGWVAVMSARPARAESEHWKITADIVSKDGEHVKLVYGNPQTGPVYFDTEAACKTEITDKKSTFNTTAWKTVQEAAKKMKATVATPTCVMDLELPKKGSI